MVFAMDTHNNEDTVQFNMEFDRIQAWWDTIQSRNRYFFELIEMRLYYIENPDLYLLLLEMDDCLDDLDIIDCPPAAYGLRVGLEQSVQDMTLGLIHLSDEDVPKAQLYFNTSKASYKQTLRDFFALLP